MPHLIADSITRTRHRPKQELVGQGIANAISGFLGGLPRAGNTLGTVVDVRAGGPFSARVRLVALRGIYTVASSNRSVNALSVDIQEHEVVILDFSETDYMDDSAALVVGQLIDVAHAEDTECVVMGADGPVADSLHALDVLRRVPSDRFVADMVEARAVSVEIPGAWSRPAAGGNRSPMGRADSGLR